MSQYDSINSSTIAVVFFAFNRADKLSNTIKSYLACTGVQTKDIVIYIDGPRNSKDDKSVNECFMVASQLLPQADIIRRIDNIGLKKSIHGGVSDVLKIYDAVIVIEDDLKLEPLFYDFLKNGIIKYHDDVKVYQISGYNYNSEEGNKAFFLPLTTSWGWATWRDKWQGFDLETDYQFLISTKYNKKRYDFDGSFNFSHMLNLESSGKISSWAIRWYSHVYSCDGLTLYPPQSLVVNDGFNETGTHSSYTSSELFSFSKSHSIESIEYPNHVGLSEQKVSSLQQHLKKHLKKKIVGYLKFIFKRVFHVK
jgi:hypothetical protein